MAATLRRADGLHLLDGSIEIKKLPTLTRLKLVKWPLYRLVTGNITMTTMTIMMITMTTMTTITTNIMTSITTKTTESTELFANCIKEEVWCVFI